MADPKDFWKKRLTVEALFAALNAAEGTAKASEIAGLDLARKVIMNLAKEAK
jgi:hypothetical protein